MSKKSQIVNNILKPNRVVEGKENEPVYISKYTMNSNGIYIPKRRKKK